MWLDGQSIGLAPEVARALGSALSLLLGAVAIGIAVRSRGPGRVLGSAAAIAALTSLPSALTGGATIRLALSSAIFLALIASLGPALARRRWRAIRIARVWALRGPSWQFDLAIAGVTIAIAVTLSYALFDLRPVIQDSQAQIFHARIFASGRLVAPSPPSPEHFLADHVITEPAFFSQYPPGHIAVLVPGVILGATWLVNPVLGALALLLIRRVGAALHGERTGRRAAMLGLVSPFVLLMSSEAMNHATTLVLVGLQILGVVHALRRGSLGWAVIAGVAAGAQILVRPISAVGIGLPLAIYVLAHAPRRWREVIAMGGAAVAVASLLLAFNAATTGDATMMGYTLRWGATHTLGFHPSPWGAPHTPAAGLDHTLSNLVGWNLFLFGGPLPAMFLVSLGAIRDRARGITIALALMPVCTLAIYFFYFFQDLAFGPRYLYESNVAALVLAARGIGWLPPLLGKRRSLLGPAIAVSIALATALFVPSLLREYYLGFCPRDGVVDYAHERIPSGRALVLVEGPYERVFFAVDPDLRARVLFARDLGDERNLELICALPDRAPWLYRGERLVALPEAARASCAGTR
jgi:hypothetical protein